MYRIAVFDDVKDDLERAAALASHYFDLTGEGYRIDRYRTPAELLRARRQGIRWDILLLDILMDGPSGLHLAEELRRIGDETDLVFITSCAEYALDGYRVSPVNYLLKPVTKETLFPVLERCLARRRQKPALMLHTEENGITAVPLKEIYYIEVFRRELVVHGCAGTITGVGSLTSLAGQLPEKSFYRSHRSFLVNLAYVSGIQRYQFLLKPGGAVPIAMRSYPGAQKKWLDFLSD